MNTLTPELIEKAKNAQTAEELLALAKDNGVELTAEDAQNCFEQLHKTGELEDNELDNVSGGGCYSKGQLVVTNFHSCDHWACEKCGGTDWKWEYIHEGNNKVHRCYGDAVGPGCATCKYMKYNGLQLCTHPANRK